MATDHPTAATRIAHAATRDMISHDAVADGKSRDISAHRDDLAARLVPSDNAAIGFGAAALVGRTIDRAQIAAAQTGRFNLNQNFACAGRWHLKFADFELAVAGQNDAGHGLGNGHETKFDTRVQSVKLWRVKNHSHYGIAVLLLAAIFSGSSVQAQPAPVAATPGTLQQFLSGDLVPLDLKFSQMQSGWSRVNIERKGETKAAAAPAFVPPDPIAIGFRRYFGQGSESVFTQGRTVNLNGGEQLVVYRAAFPDDEEIRIWFDGHMPDEMKGSERLKPEREFELMFSLVRQLLDTVPMRASLVKVSEIGGLKDVEPFAFERAFAALESDVRDPNSVFNRGRNRSRSQSSRVSLQLLAQGLNNYIQDYEEVLPPLANWEVANKALQPYIKSEIKLAQPDQKIYTNSLLSAKKLAHLQPYAQSLIVFYSNPDQSGNRWAVFLDGKVEEINNARWPQIKQASRLP